MVCIQAASKVLRQTSGLSSSHQKKDDDDDDDDDDNDDDDNNNIRVLSCFGGLGVACWPLVPKFAGSNPAKKSSARLPSEGK